MGEARRPPGGAIIGHAGAPLRATLDRRGPAARRCCGWRLRLGDLEAADARVVCYHWDNWSGVS